MKRHKRVRRGRVYDENLFNRTSDKVHGVSSRLRRFVKLSISFRISMSYSWLLLKLFVPFAVLLTLLFGYLQAPTYAQKQREAMELMPSPEQVGVELLRTETGAEITGVEIAGGWGFYVDAEPLRIRAQYVFPYENGEAHLLFPLEENARVLRMLLLGLLGFLVLASLAFLLKSRKINQRVLRPIADITATAQQMSEKNLSARINVAGTQNELRELAIVINDMLSRLEAAIGRQKQFVSDASHELRTPIAVIQGYAGLLARWGKDNPEVLEEAITAITQETLSMKELVENLLFLARHDKSTLKLTFEAFDSAEMLRDLLRETELIATKHEIVAGDIAPQMLTADRSSVKQAVRVFVDNAIKYTPPGGKVGVSSRVLGESLHITVRDNGKGIAKADLARLFDRFFRADDARNSQTGGHGLGLAIARIIVVSHGGKIHVKSKPGEGSAFTLVIPLEAKAAETFDEV